MNIFSSFVFLCTLVTLVLGNNCPTYSKPVTIQRFEEYLYKCTPLQKLNLPERLNLPEPSKNFINKALYAWVEYSQSDFKHAIVKAQTEEASKASNKKDAREGKSKFGYQTKKKEELRQKWMEAYDTLRREGIIDRTQYFQSLKNFITKDQPSPFGMKK